MKRKMIAFLVTILLCFNVIQAFASSEIRLVDYYQLDREESVRLKEELLGDFEPLEIDGRNMLAYLTEIDNEQWVVYGEYSPYAQPKKYSEAINNPLFNNRSVYDYIKIDDGYMVRKRYWDYIAPAARRTYQASNTLDFYDENFQLISQENFGGCIHVDDMGYYDGKYYCSYFQEYENTLDAEGNVIESVPIHDFSKPSNRNITRRRITMVSEDRVNWTETEEAIPRNNGLVSIQDDKVDLGLGNMLHVAYEDPITKKYLTTFGELYIKENESFDLYFSKDNVYYIKATLPEDIRKILLRYSKSTYSYYAYNGNLIISLSGTDKQLIIPMEEIYAELEQMELSPHVQLNNEILGFETPPVLESDRTLVPMRFLFEKMGAEVTWDEVTNTATATLPVNVAEQIQTFGMAQPKSVSFSIDNPAATVNGEAQEMDVPARLINDKTMVPLRFLSENLGYTVTWDDATNTAIIE